VAQYRVGTVTVTNSDATVVGVGTAFDTEVTAGDLFAIDSDNTIYRVASVTDALNLELTATYAGGTSAGEAYSITRDFTAPDNLPLPVKGDVQTALVVNEAIVLMQAKFLNTRIVVKTSGDTLVANDSFTHYTNEGAGGDIDLALPSAVAGLTFTAFVQEANEIKFTAATGDTIRNAASVSASAGNIRASTIGNVVVLECINTTEWFVKSIIGTWTLT
jgi:uncharacterized ubiquitin-like protein YukD